MRAIVIHAAKDLRVEERAEEAIGPGQLRLRLATALAALFSPCREEHQ